MENINLGEVLKMTLYKNRKHFDILINQNKYQYLYLFPILSGALAVLTFYLKDNEVTDIWWDTNKMLYYMFISSVASLFSCYLLAWIVLYLSNLFKGIANLKLTFAIISYSQVLALCYYLLIIIIEILLHNDKFQPLFKAIVICLSIVYLLRYLYFVVAMNSKINSFSTEKSILIFFIVGIILAIAIMIYYVNFVGSL
jgi:hypothetical protein